MSRCFFILFFKGLIDELVNNDISKCIDSVRECWVVRGGGNYY